MQAFGTLSCSSGAAINVVGTCSILRSGDGAIERTIPLTVALPGK